LAAIGRGYSEVALWNLDERRQLHRFGNPAGERFSDVALSKDGRELAVVGADHLLRVFDTETFVERSRLRGHDDEILGVSISPAGGLIATAGNDRTVRLWSSVPPAVSAVSYTEPSPIAAASITEPLILIRHGDGAVECWNAAARTAATTPPDAGRIVAGFLPDGRTFYTMRKGADGGLIIEQWNADARPLGSPRVVSTAVSDWQTAAFSPHAGLVAVSDKKKALEFIWADPAKGTSHLDAIRRTTDHFLFSPDGKFLCGYTWPNRVNVWNARSGEFLGRRAIAPGGTVANSFSPDSLMLATAGEDNIITVQDLASGATIATLRGHKAHIRAVAFSPDGKTLASSSSDQTLRLWHVGTWREMGTLHRGTEFTSLAFAGNPTHLVAVSGEGRMVFKGAESQPD
jgi:WD40 repeat protein